MHHDMSLSVQIICEPGARLPSYGSNLAAGADLYAWLPNDSITLAVGERVLVPTGIKIQLPVGYEAQVRPRSGLASKHGVTVLNTPGTIDADYRGEVKVILINLGSEPFIIRDGDRIAQMVVAAHQRCSFEETDHLDDTTRGSGGFGSTGV